MAKPADPKKTGYVFAGWYNGSAKWNFNSAVTSDMTLKAKWTKIAGRIAPAAKTVKKGRKLKLTAGGNAAVQSVKWATSKKANVKILSGSKKKTVTLKGMKKGKKSVIKAVITFKDGTKRTVKRTVTVK